MLSDAATMDTEFLSDLLTAGERDGAFRLSGEPTYLARSILDVVAGSPAAAGEKEPQRSRHRRRCNACAAFVLSAVGSGRS